VTDFIIKNIINGLKFANLRVGQYFY